MNALDKKVAQAIGILRQFGATKVLLFGSALDDPSHARDLDLAVEGVPLKSLLRADTELYESLRIEVDLIAREESPRFYESIRPYSKVVYDSGTAGY